MESKNNTANGAGNASVGYTLGGPVILAAMTPALDSTPTSPDGEGR